MKWSSFQEDIFNEVLGGSGNILVQACPGGGKTATIVEAIYRIPSGLSVMACAFNTRIKDALIARLPEHIQVNTIHAFGFAAIKASFGKDVQLDNDKISNITKALVGAEDDKVELRYLLAQAIGLCKGCLVNTPEEISEILDEYEFDCGTKNDRTEFINNIIKGMEFSAQQTKIIDFNDMIWFVIRHNLTVPTFDWIVVDETQDLNRLQLEILMKAMKSNGRIMIVGDKYQAIYKFAGADSNSMDRIASRTGAKTLPLSVSYRCGKNIVKEAQALVPDIQYAEEAEEGVVESVDVDYMMKNAGPGDFILSRTNRPLIGLCFQFLKEGRRANIIGRDIGQNLVWVIKKSKAQSVQGFLEYLESWKNAECERLIAKNRDCTHIMDKYECLLTFCEGAFDLDEVKKNIEEMFSDKDDNTRIMLGTVHKAKGLERDRCWLLRNTFKTGKNQEETNITYVAITRAKSFLYWVDGVK